MIARELHSVAELQEASRFTAFEKEHRDFERAFIARLGTGPIAQQDTQRRMAAVLAAKLGLYVNDPNRRGRIPVAATLSTGADAADPVAAQALAEAMQTRGMRAL